MSTYSPDFDAAATDVDYDLPPWMQRFNGDADTSGCSYFPLVAAPAEFEIPPPVDGAPLDVGLALFAFDEGGYSNIRMDGVFGPSATISFDFACGHFAGDHFFYRVDAEDVDDFPALATWQHYTHAIPAGEHTLEVWFVRGSVPDDTGGEAFTAAMLDNLVITDATFEGDPGSEPPGPAPYQRGEWLRHLGGLYVCRVDGATTEPGPGDSAEWFEAVARPSTTGGYTPDPRDIPVRAATTNPFDADETGLWLVLDGDGNVTAQTYVTAGG